MPWREVIPVAILKGVGGPPAASPAPRESDDLRARTDPGGETSSPASVSRGGSAGAVRSEARRGEAGGHLQNTHFLARSFRMFYSMREKPSSQMEGKCVLHGGYNTKREHVVNTIFFVML